MPKIYVKTCKGNILKKNKNIFINVLIIGSFALCSFAKIAGQALAWILLLTAGVSFLPQSTLLLRIAFVHTREDHVQGMI